MVNEAKLSDRDIIQGWPGHPIEIKAFIRNIHSIIRMNKQPIKNSKHEQYRDTKYKKCHGLRLGNILYFLITDDYPSKPINQTVTVLSNGLLQRLQHNQVQPETRVEQLNL